MLEIFLYSFITIATGIIFYLEMLVPPSIAISTTYIGLIFVTIWIKHKYTTYSYTLLCITLTVIAALLHGRFTIEYVVDDLLAVVGMVLAALLAQYNKDITAKVNAERLKLQAVLTASRDPLIVANSYGIIKFASDSVLKVFGWHADELIGKNVAVLMPDPYKSSHDNYMAEYRKSKRTKLLGLARELTGERRDGSVFPCEVALGTVVLPDNDAEYFSATIKDITVRKALEKEVLKLTVMDGLTGLYNRRYCDEQLEKEYLRAKRGNYLLGVILLDIDNFKKYNDTYGHQAGDKCLQQVARAIKANVKRAGDFVARYGGEEFIIVVPNITKKKIFEFADTIRIGVAALQIPHKHSTHDKVVTVSCGYCLESPFNAKLPEIVQKADLALYLAKDSGRNKVVSHEEV